MNAAFSYIFLISTAVLFTLSPERFLPALLEGGTNAASLCVALLSSYSLWLGLMRVWEECGVTNGVSRLLRPAVKKIFAIEKDDAVKTVCMNLSANALGIGGAATPYGIEAAKKIDEEKNAKYASSMLFVVNASSLQLLPTTLVTMRTACGSDAPFDIIFPTLIATVLSTVLGILLVRLFIRKDSEPQKEKKSLFRSKRVAGARL